MGAAAYKDMKFLIVDDQKTMLRIIKNLLGQIGFENVTEATSGKEALSILNSKKIDFVISDWNMDEMTGLELLVNVRSHANDNVRSMPFIMVTAESKIENVMEAKKAGVNQYIVKPFNADTLKTKLKSVLGDFENEGGA